VQRRRGVVEPPTHGRGSFSQIKLIVKPDQATATADPFQDVQQVDIMVGDDMSAGVRGAPAFIHPGRGAPARKGGRLKNLDGEPAFGQFKPGGQSGQTGADDKHSGGVCGVRQSDFSYG
jgi:hypothetical protein